MDNKTREKKFRTVRIICTIVIPALIVETAYYTPEDPILKGILIGLIAILSAILVWHLAGLGVVTGELFELYRQKDRIDDTVARKIKKLESALYRAGHRLNAIDRGEGDEFLWEIDKPDKPNYGSKEKITGD